MSARELADEDRAAVVSEVVFAPIGGEGLAQQTVRRLAEGISLGLLKEGERLPPEAQLSKWLGVSQLTLREALGVLRQAGYLETRRGTGGGSFVRGGPPLPTTDEAQRALARLTPELLHDFTDLRIAVSREASRLAAERATEEEVAGIEQLAEETRRTKDYRDYRPVDAAFHIAIASASGSARLATTEARLQVELGEILNAAIRLLEGEMDPAVRASNREHLALAAAIRARDPERAQTIAASHAEGTLNVQLALTASLRS